MFGTFTIVGRDRTEEFPLEQETAGIGRAADNELNLPYPTVSLHHARLAADASGCSIMDLGSSNGTFVNGAEIPVKVAQLLKDGDSVLIGPYELRFHAAATAPTTGRADETILASAASVAVAARRRPGHTVVLPPVLPPRLVVSTPEWSREFPLLKDSVTIGREPDNDIVVGADVVSRHHAVLQKRDGGYLITDLGSTNGLNTFGQLVKEKLLAPGDFVCIGQSVTLEYRGAEDMAMTGLPADAGAISAAGPARAAIPTGAPGSVCAPETPSPVYEIPENEALVLGRGAETSVHLAHPVISQVHAQVQRQAGQYMIQDMGSSAGTYVNGRPVTQQALSEGDVIRIGPNQLMFQAGQLRLMNEEGCLRLDAFHLTKTVGKGMPILRDISISIKPQEFVAVVGGSGAGKSTLVNALCGFKPASEGAVMLNGVDLYHNFDAYRNEMGYVPQDDIIHVDLTVAKALEYAAHLRMPPDTSRQERKRRVAEVIDELDLKTCANRIIKQLSGGQRKRVSIGVELLTRPSLFFLDEATSGLDPATEAQMMKLLRRLADQGRTILLITHATKNVMACDKVVFLARGGYLAYFGPPEDALQYFGVKDFDEIYERLESGAKPEEWAARYQASPQLQQYVVQPLNEVACAWSGGAAAPQWGGFGGPAAYQGAYGGAYPAQYGSYPAQYGGGYAPGNPGQGYAPAYGGAYAGGAPGGFPARAAAPPGAHARRTSGWSQFWILSARYLNIIWRDKKTALLLLLISPILGALDFVTWDRNLFDPLTGSATKVVTMLFMTSLISVLVGTITSVREIVKENAVYRRERMVCLKVLPYVASKVAVGAIFALYSASVLFFFKTTAVSFAHLSGAQMFQLFVPFVLGTFAGLMWGLLVSAVAPSEDRAMLLVILVLVPQFVFSGGMVPVSDLGVAGKVFGVLTSTRWGLGAMATSAQIKTGTCVAPDMSDCSLPGLEGLSSPAEKVALVKSLDNQYGNIFHVNVYFYWAMATVLMLVLLLLIFILQKRKDTL
jgi:ABC transport system ATP-binding/permease protein